MDKILYCLCSHCVGILDGWRPFPATIIAKNLGMSVHKVRYHLRKLKGLSDMLEPNAEYEEELE